MQAEILLADPFEAGLGQWVAQPPWGLTTQSSASPTHSVTDSPGAFYADNIDASLGTASALNLAGRLRPVLAFKHRHSLESGYDFGRVEISLDGGASWQPAPLANYTGERPDWTEEQLDLAAYSAATNVKLRFRLVTDASVVRDGWYLDDVRVGEAPAPVVLAAPSSVQRNSLVLQWSASTTPNFAAYEIYRSLVPGAPLRDAQKIGDVSAIGTTTFTDITAVPKTAYYYQLVVRDADGLRGRSNEVTATTLAGMDFPFLDSGEAGPANWTADAPWALSTEQAQSATHAWSDSPGGNYAPSISSQALTLAAPLNLTTSGTPVLMFSHRHEFAGGDSGYVEVSTNGGTDWSTLATFSGSSPESGWLRGRIDLSAYRLSAVLLRFRLTSDPGPTADGWHVDDISVAEAPPIVGAPVADQVTSSSVRLTWAPVSFPQLAQYAVFRDTTSGVGLNSTLVALVPSTTTTCTDHGLSLDTTYHYRVYAVTSYGTYSADSASWTQVRTANHPLPFAEGFEGPLVNWMRGGNTAPSTWTWGLTGLVAHTGTQSLSDSPSGNYGTSADTWIETSLNLSGTSWPVLRFWDRYQLGGGDWMRVEIAGVPVYGNYDTGERTDWREQVVDLSPWKGQSSVRVRYRLVTDSVTPADGWYVDDVTATENPLAATPLTLPFLEGFESGLNAWLPAGWATQANPAALDGASVAVVSTHARFAPDTQQMLTLAQPLALAPGSNVQVTFFVRGAVLGGTSFRLQSSTDGGTGWTDLTSANLDGGFDTGGQWVQRQASLAALAGQTVRLRFVASADYAGRFFSLAVDRLTIGESPAAASLETIAAGLRSIDLTWSGSTLGAAFQRFELWRSTTANVTRTNGVKVFETASPAAGSRTDSGLLIGQTYYYRLFTVDTRDTYAPSNELSAQTVPVILPFADPAETLANWVLGGSSAPSTWTWGVTANSPHGGSGAFAQAPVGQYAPSADTWIETSVNLTGATWPVLTFWDRYQLGSGDWTRVEVYAPSYGNLLLYGDYSTGGRSEWRRQQIDLSSLRGLANVRIRFRTVTDGAGEATGWDLDDLSVAENPLAGTPLTLPFTEGFESGLGQWIAGSWTTQTDPGALEGTSVAIDAQHDRLAPDTQHALTLAKPIVLPPGSNVQVTAWLRGYVPGGTAFRLYYSVDGGLSWPELATFNVDGGFDSAGQWTRRQASLAALAGQTVRLRFSLLGDYAGRQGEMALDKITIAEAPVGSSLLTIAPGLRSMELQWAPSALGANFQRFELWRSTSPNVTVTNGTQVFTSTNAGITSFADSGLLIGQTYYYRLFTVDTRDTYAPSNELSAQTVPVILPFADPAETLANWVLGGNSAPSTWTWGVTANSPHGGSGAFAQAPVGQYAPSADTWIETSVNLTGSTWPVLTFWDRYQLGSGDWTRVEVYAPAYGNLLLYGDYSTGGRSAWRRQQIDLSSLRGLANVRIRFRTVTDGAGEATGWDLDDLSVAENPLAGTPLSLPFTEGFESGLGQWIAGSWTTQTDPGALEGTSVAIDAQHDRLAPDTQHALTLAKPIVLPPGSNVQVTAWLRGYVPGGTAFRLYYSVDGGLSWPELATFNVDGGFDSAGQWTRRQASLAALAGQTVRLRFSMMGDYAGRQGEMALDKITIAEAPAAVVMTPIDQIGIASLRLNWEASSIPDFQAYRIYRSTSSSVSDASTQIAAITDQGVTSFVDTGLDARVVYYYRIYVESTRDVRIASLPVSARTLGVTLPFVDGFESALPGWTFTGLWQRVAGAGNGGTAGLVDSPGDYLPGTDSNALFAVDLTSAVRPVLRFEDRHAFSVSSWGRVEVRAEGQGWSVVYGVVDTRNNWQSQAIDLSEWRGQASVYLRFRVGTDGNLADGWRIDQLALTDDGPPSAVTSLFEDFEAGAPHFLSAAWAPDSENPHTGLAAWHDTKDRRNGPDTPNLLTLLPEIDLSTAVAPQLSFWMRGSLPGGTSFRVQVSTDHGTSWNEISSLNRDGGYDQPIWERRQASLAPWIGLRIRLRFVSSGDYAQRLGDVWLDDIGVGEPAPATPALVSPVGFVSVPEVRPVLTLANAVDFQSDPLTYRFEVYSDAALTSLVAQVPAVAQGAGTTSWQVDINLPNNSQYWWRARASDGANDGPWSETATFYVNEVNHPPLAVALVGPPAGAIFVGGTERFTWLPTTDPDAGDSIVTYHLQAAQTSDFASPVIDAPAINPPPSLNASETTISVALGSLPGAGNLLPGRAYYWRVRARDNRLAWSEWNAGPRWFRYLTAQPTAYQFWQDGYFTPEELNDPATSDATSDPDGDGLNNLFEFATATNPHAANSAARPVASLASGALQLTYRQRNGGTGTVGLDYTAAGLRYAVELSTGLAGPWQSGGAFVELVPGGVTDNGDGTQTVTVRSKLALALQPRQFLRLKLLQNP